uniref:Uncharacterized protein n=1 Tax=Bos mutus grunniens TaxID=30521 RepID=A0A8C0A9L6_BOSMU
MAVASTKSRWETGEVQAQSAAKSAPDIVAGDMSKRDLWEQKGGPKTSLTVKVPEGGRRGVQVCGRGHGKYEKVLVGEGSAPRPLCLVSPQRPACDVLCLKFATQAPGGRSQEEAPEGRRPAQSRPSLPLWSPAHPVLGSCPLP